ncbi:hypothetical protein AVEN_240932-1 [Araneus ventricosus]|uniref:Uncharacterized protein n=1 Tax=Araneus ventricosus TaxID=182803 RepID=A0A4Y2UM14_ARAVE|nr:hypothetical protein AVEN_240932-1 [Araneus ventricosus]
MEKWERVPQNLQDCYSTPLIIRDRDCTYGKSARISTGLLFTAPLIIRGHRDCTYGEMGNSASEFTGLLFNASDNSRHRDCTYGEMGNSASEFTGLLFYAKPMFECFFCWRK